MSVQEVIADQIEGEVIGSGWDVAATRDQANAMACRAVKALEAKGYAVVQLPEPIHHCRKDTAWPSVMDQLVTAVHSRRRHHVRLTGDVEWFTADEAEQLAGSLLAAAKVVSDV